jgi:serine/threonine protein kinase
MVPFVEPLADHDPRQVGGFRLQARLGAGGMGRVYLGYSPGGRPVAVKVVHPDLARDPEFMQRFRREVNAAQAVSDAYTAAVVGAGPDDSPPWLATTFVPGPSLADLISRAGPLPEDAVWRLAGGLAEALQAIHAQGLVHRDLKPGNILIAGDGPRVIDFGISRVTGGTVVTATRMTIGTPAYMSPEQAEGDTVGPSSDIFSLGSVLAFAATGTSPFGGGAEMFAVAYRVVHGEPNLTGVPASLRPMIDACLAKDPAARPVLGQLLRDVSVGAAAHPQVTPGRFWPDQVSAVLESSAFTPALPPLTQAPQPGPPTEVVGSGQYTPTSAGVAAATTDVAHPGRYTPAAAAASVTPRRRGPRWLLPVILGLAVAAAAGIAIALAVSPGQKPPAFLAPSGAATATSGTATSGSSTGGSSTSGRSTGGSPTAGSSTPGTPTGGSSTSGGSTGGSSASGSATPGTPTGGGSTSGGSTSGG